MEEWQDIPGYEGHFQASTLGNIKSLDRKVWTSQYGGMFKYQKGLMRKQNISVVGYRIVILKKDNRKKNLAVHRLVALTFIENPLNKKCINHKNGVKTDNRVENLEWVTYKENLQHAFDTGLKTGMPPESCWTAVLTEKIVKEIIPQLATTPVTQIAKAYQLKRHLVYRIKHGITWNSLTGFEKRNYRPKKTA